MPNLFISLLTTKFYAGFVFSIFKNFENNCWAKNQKSGAGPLIAQIE
jgi:hypothetical protein